MRLKTWWRDVRHSLLKKTAKATAERVVDKALDDLEDVLLGDETNANDLLKEQASLDPLSRIRAQHGIEAESTTQSSTHGKAKDAQAELARLKEKYTKN